MLLTSEKDDIALAFEVSKRALEVGDLYRNRTGLQLQMPPDMVPDFKLMQAMVSRHQKGDFRHTVDEKLALKSVAQWTLDMNCDLRGQPRKNLTWKD